MEGDRMQSADVLIDNGGKETAGDGTAASKNQETAEFEEIDAGMSPEKKAEMIQRSNGGRTFPQIFVGEHHIGGCDDMMALERAGKLDPMLASP